MHNDRMLIYSDVAMTVGFLPVGSWIIQRATWRQPITTDNLWPYNWGGGGGGGGGYLLL